MKQQEKQAMGKAIYDVFSGIIANNLSMMSNNTLENFTYDFSAPSYQELKTRYHLPQIAKQGSEFQRALRLMNYFSHRLNHESMYDNHVPSNALDLLAYSLNQKDHGINCLNKAKIMVECCLALGIYTRRVSLMPYSPYDYDNHVVIEIYDQSMAKWIMLDPTTNSYFIDEKKQPLSCFEIRMRAGKRLFTTSIKVHQTYESLHQLFIKNIEYNYYIMKNMFYFYIDQHNGVGNPEKQLLFIPLLFDVKKKTLMNINYKIAEYTLKNVSQRIIDTLLQHKARIEGNDIVVSSYHLLNESPIKKPS